MIFLVDQFHPNITYLSILLLSININLSLYFPQVEQVLQVAMDIGTMLLHMLLTLEYKIMKLNEKELKTMKEIVFKYSSLNDEFNETQKKLKELQSKNDTLLSQLESIREEENRFYESLKDSYGEGRLDFEKLEYIPI